MKQDVIIVFTRFPIPGKVKTRLIPVIGETGAAELQRSLTEAAVEQAFIASGIREADLEIWFSGGSESKMEKWLGSRYIYRKQPQVDLGLKLETAMCEAMLAGYKRAVLTGSDIPSLSSSVILSAFESLTEYDVVIGPAIDGGYYLIGLKSIQNSLFKDIPWSTGKVLEKTIKRANKKNLSIKMLKMLADIDIPDDLYRR